MQLSSKGRDISQCAATTGQTLPEDIMMAVNLLPFPGTLQDPAVADHGTAGALGAVAALGPVVQHQPAGSGVEEGQRVAQGYEHTQSSQ